MADQSGVYGTQGVPAAGNVPGARRYGVSCLDGPGDLWLVGGEGRDGAGSSGQLNDLWRYDPSAGQWTWMSGSSTVNQSGVYGTQGTPAAGNVPGARSSSISWLDGSGKLWLFGGIGRDSAGSFGWLNDLWHYELDSPTLVELVSFTGAYKDGAVRLTWGTAGEVDHAGFHLWRNEGAKGLRSRLTETMILAQGGPTLGAEYAYEDTDLVPGRTYEYELEAVDAHGRSTFYGLVEVEVPESAFGAEGGGEFTPLLIRPRE
jgi:hypothetical protein